MKKTFYYQFIMALLPFTLPLQVSGAPSGVSLGTIQTSGSGCHNGSVVGNISPDGKALTMIFNQYEVENEGKSSAERIRTERKTCSIDVDVRGPSGWCYGLVSAQFRGFATLDPEVYGRISARFETGNQTNFSISGLTLAGEFDDDYQLGRTTDLRDVKWARAGSKLEIDSSVTVTSRQTGAQGYMTVDSIDAEISQKYNLLWKRCSANAGYIGVCRGALVDKDDTSTVFREYRDAQSATSRKTALQTASRNALYDCENDRLGDSEKQCRISCQSMNLESSNSTPRVRTNQKFEAQFNGQGRPRYDWTVFLSGQEFDDIKCATYYLHSSFSQPVRKRCSSSNGFALSTDGWGGFYIPIKLEMKNGSEKWVYHRLALPTSAHRPVQVTTKQWAKKRSSSGGKKPVFDWKVWLSGSDLSKIKCVNYTLHSSFGNGRYQKRCNRDNGFLLSADGWGGFSIKMELELTSGRKQRLTHRLRLK